MYIRNSKRIYKNVYGEHRHGIHMPKARVLHIKRNILAYCCKKIDNIIYEYTYTHTNMKILNHFFVYVQRRHSYILCEYILSVSMRVCDRE